MPNAKDMTTVAAAAGRLGVSTSETSLPALITAASSALATFLGYTVQRREGVEETVRSEGGRYLWLRSGALQSISSISVNGADLDTASYAIDGEKGAIQGRIIARGSTRFPYTGEWTGGISSTPFRSHDTGEIVCTFAAGWKTPGQVALTTYDSSDMPEELEQACIEVVTAWYSDKGRDTRVTSMSTGDASIGWGADSVQGGRAALPLPARVLAEPYRKLR